MIPIHLGISTCPNDTFTFHGILEEKVNRRGLDFQIELLDVEELNQRLFAGDFDVAKASFHAALRLASNIVVLPVGSALGFGVGPLLLAALPRTHPRQAVHTGQNSPRPARILCPGRHTTATLLYFLFHHGEGTLEQAVFSAIMPALTSHTADFGVCIHEGRFTWREHGLALVEDLGHTTPRMFISSQQLFQTGETVTGGTSGASGTVTRYRANPVQNIQQLLAYADIDNTIYDFIEEFRKSFMEGIPSNLANGINKRNLEKHIRELYRRKGTKEGAKLFMKILLDETSDIFYPNQYMMKASDADWDKPTIIRCASSGSAVARELIGQSVTGRTSAATALVENSTTFAAAGGIFNH